MTSDPPAKPPLSLSTLSAALDSLDEGLSLFDADDRLLLVNRRVPELFPEMADLIRPGARFEDLLRALVARGGATDAVGHEDAWIADRLERRRQRRGLDHLRRPGGRSLHVHESTTADGGSIVIYRDFTELRRRDDELSTANRVLNRADQLSALGELMAGITHEIKNSLSLMSNFAEISGDLVQELQGLLQPMADGLSADARRELDELMETLDGNLTTIADHGTRANGIVRSMLQTSRSAGNPLPTEVNRLIEESLALARFGTQANTPGFRVVMELQLDPAAGVAELDPQEINRVMLNLCSNAYHAMYRRLAREGGDYRPVLSVRTEGQADSVLIRVHDNGTGIAAEDRERVFQRFFTTKPVGEGTGLGLSLCQDIARRHGGRLTLASEPGAYTEFTLELPRRGGPT